MSLRKMFPMFLIVLFFGGVFAVSAQETTLEPTLVATDPAPEVTPEPPKTETGIPPNEAADKLLTDIVAIVASWGAVVGTAGAILVGFAKYIPGLNQVSGATLSILVNGLLMVGYWVASHYGLLEPYQLGLGQIESIGQALLALISTVLGSAFIHERAAKAKLPVVGYKRTP